MFRHHRTALCVTGISDKFQCRMIIILAYSVSLDRIHWCSLEFYLTLCSKG